MFVIIKKDSTGALVDELYPYGLENSWGDTIYCDLNDLIKLKEEIEKLLKEVNKNGRL